MPASLQVYSRYAISKSAVTGLPQHFAMQVGLAKFAHVFYESEINEKHIDDELTQLAIYEINNNALSPLNLEQ